mgnify:CR=1 FL=1
MEHPVLETHGLTVRFGGHVAVSAVSCAFRPGTLTAIVGPNGAGKTTYFNLVSGQLKATSGRVSLYGEDISGLSASQRTHRGIGRAFQLTNLFPRLSVLENVRLAVQSRAGRGRDLWSMWGGHVELIEKAEHFLERVALEGRRDAIASTLPHGDQRKLEVAILLALVVVFVDGARLHRQPDEDAVFRPCVATYVIAQAVGKRADPYLGIGGQRLDICLFQHHGTCICFRIGRQFEISADRNLFHYRKR